MRSSDYIKMIGSYGNCIIAKKDQFEVPAITDLRGVVSSRVHNVGVDDSGQSRAYKSKAYKTKNNKVNPVNMVLTGDLRRDYNHYKSQGDNVLGFQDELSIKKIEGEESRRKGRLFNVTDEEVIRYRKQLFRFFDKIQRQCLKLS